MPTATTPPDRVRAPHPLRHVRGAVTLTVCVTWLLLCFVVFLPVALVKLLPIAPLRLRCARGLAAIATVFGHGLRELLRVCGIGDLRITTSGAALDPTRCYLLVCNHQSWADIVYLLAWHAGRVPFPRFFLKRELLWFPVIGFVCWAMDFPFMRRYARNPEADPERARRDRQAARVACARYRNLPVTIVNYAEGTRFTPDKRDAQASPWPHLLRPRAGGASYVFTAMGEQLAGIIDMTLIYPHVGGPGLWRFFTGEAQPVYLHIDVQPVPATVLGRDADATHDATRAWINALWADKNARIANMRGDSGTARAA